MKSVKLSFPTESFRLVETPFDKTHREYVAVVNVKNLPDLTGWRKINVRDAKLTGAVPNAIRGGLHDYTDLFVFLNRGITMNVDAVSLDNQTKKLEITLSDPEIHGLLDGGHTFDIIREEMGGLEGAAHVRIEILQGFSKDEIPLVVEARNTSNQVSDESLMNLRREFEGLKDALKGELFFNHIAWKEFQVDQDGNPLPIDVREIISILTAFDRDSFDEREHPINAYRSKGACLKYFKERVASYEKLYPIAGDLLRLYDEVNLELPEQYNESGGKFGKLTGVTTYNGRKPRLLYTGKEVKWGVPTGFVYPVLGAFRALLELKNGRYAWGKGLDPMKLIRGDLGKQLAVTIGEFAKENRNPSKTGKSGTVWQACYSLAEVAYLKAKG